MVSFYRIGTLLASLVARRSTLVVRVLPTRIGTLLACSVLFDAWRMPLGTRYSPLAKAFRVLEHSMLDETAFRVSEQHSMLATHSVFQKQAFCVPEHVFHVKQHSLRVLESLAIRRSWLEPFPTPPPDEMPILSGDPHPRQRVYRVF
jgi:hypothetical protein